MQPSVFSTQSVGGVGTGQGGRSAPGASFARTQSAPAPGPSVNAGGWSCLFPVSPGFAFEVSQKDG